MIDLHAHVLPAVDDGPGSTEAAVTLVREAGRAGVRTIAATPHVDAHFGLTAPRILAALEGLRGALARARVAVEVLPGAEIALPRLLDLTDDDLARLGLGGGPCLLVEAPLARLPGAWEWPVLGLLDRGHRVLLAHPERCPTFQREPGRLAALLDAGAWCQLTTGSLTGAFGGPPFDTALALLREDRVHNLASDAHDVMRRPPGVPGALAGLPELEGRLEWLTEEVPAALLAGDAPPSPPTRRVGVS